MSNENTPPPGHHLARSLLLPKHYGLLISVADVNVIQNSLRKMIDAEKMVLQDAIVRKNVKLKKMREQNVAALSSVRDRIGFQVDQIDAAALQKGSQGTKGV